MTLLAIIALKKPFILSQVKCNNYKRFYSIVIYVKYPVGAGRTFSEKQQWYLFLCVNIMFFLFFFSKDMGILSSDHLDQLKLNSCHVKRAVCKTAPICSVSLKIKCCTEGYFQANVIGLLFNVEWSCFLIKGSYKTTSYLQFCFEV